MSAVRTIIGLLAAAIALQASTGTSPAAETSVFTTPATNVAGGKATLNGIVNPGGVATSYRFDYVEDGAFKATGWAEATRVPDPAESVGSGESNVSVSEPALWFRSGVLYHYRVVAITSSKTLYGATKTFTMPYYTPTVSTNAPSGVHTATADVSGLIQPDGSEAVYSFQYGTSRQYGEGTPGQVIPAGSKTPVNASAQLQNLQPNTTYHYRIIVLTDTEVTAASEDRTFTTSNGLYLRSGEGGQAQIASTTNPWFMFGEADGAFTVFKSGSAAAQCTGSSGTFNGGAVAGPISSFDLNSGAASFVGCEFLGQAAQVKLNSCSYSYTVDSVGQPYTGSVKISCPAGKEIEVVSAACTVKIPGQSPSGTNAVTYEEVSGPSAGAIRADASASGLSFTKSGPLCFLVPGTSGASFSGAFELYY